MTTLNNANRLIKFFKNVKYWDLIRIRIHMKLNNIGIIKIKNNDNNNNNNKSDKYLDFARELKKLWNMKVTIIPNVIGVFGMVTKGLLKGLDDLEVGG